MSLELAFCLSILIIGFTFGYGLRTGVSYHHRAEARRRRLL